MGILDDIKGFTGDAKKRMGGVLGLTDRRSQPDKPVLTPRSDREREQVSILTKMLEDAKKARQPWEPAWKKGYEYFVGNQYPNRRKRWKANPKVNYLWRNTEAMVSRLTNNKPTISVISTTPEAEESVNGVQKLIEAWWDELDMRRKIADGTRGSLVMGDYFYYTYWDHEKQQPCTELTSGKAIYVNPGATSIEDATYLAHVSTMPIWKVWQYWPSSKGKVAPGGTTTSDPMKELEDMAPVDPTGEQPVYFDLSDSSGTQRAYGNKDFFGDSTGGDTDMVQVVQFWVRDPARTKEPMTWDDGLPAVFPDGTPMWLDKPKYPGGRHVVMAGQRIVHDAPNPFDHGEFPYVHHRCYGVPDEFWSISFVYNLISPQKELNKTLAQVTEYKNLMGQPRVIADKNSGFDPNMDTSKPGQVWFKNPGTTVDVVQTPPMNSSFTDMIAFDISTMKEISGINDASAGIKPPGVQSGVALQTLAMQSQTQSGTLENNIEDVIRDIGRQWVALARQYMEEHRYVQTTDDQGNVSFMEVTPEMIRNEWSIKVGVGSTLPVDRNLLFEQAVQALQVGLLDVEGALRWWRHPEAERQIKRLKAQQAMQEQIAAQQSRIQANGQRALGQPDVQFEEGFDSPQMMGGEEMQ